MKFSTESLKNDTSIYRESEAFSGVNKIADKVLHDIFLVFDAVPEMVCERTLLKKQTVIYGTIGKSPILDALMEAHKISADEITGKREVYLFQIVKDPMEGVEEALVIAGSDKRGTIYGLFHLSELIGVSPLIDWNDVIPAKKEYFYLEENLKYISKEPSVKFRGFFINDEWPAFGSWCTKRFGGFNARAYEHVFELLLRLKGNYLWPAMWSARFPEDGPGLLNAELADEYGVIMGMSHHEPCLRQGEEYKYLRGKDSIYGDAWNFRVNKEGITRFWEDGLKRSGKFENVITVGMRGEADTAIMGQNATLKDNIELLRDVLRTQRQLIKENVNEDLSKVPRMIALYKEVEEFFYGTEDTEGLIGCEELEDVILMLCDDNFGNLRTLPTEEMRKHKGGYGMYYHFDYHGWPVSYEWINSSFLPKIWEQMTTAYEFGIRDLWIVNVGDIGTQEFPLSYFLDLAYDFEKWGTTAINQTEHYTKEWIHTQFGSILGQQELHDIYDILEGYTKIAHKRRPEAMNADIYHPVHYRESEQTLSVIDDLLAKADHIYKKIDEKHLPAYVSLVYYPAAGSLNLYKMQIYAGLNHYFAQIGAMAANVYADKIKECLRRDKELVEQYHTIDDEKWYGMGMSEHIGFTQWNEDECKNPVLMYTEPADKERIILSIDGTGERAEGSPWLKHTLTLNDFLEPDISRASFTLYNVTDLNSHYSIENDIPWIRVSQKGGVLDNRDNIWKTVTVEIDRTQLKLSADIIQGEIYVNLPAGKCTIQIPVMNMKKDEFKKHTYFTTKDYASIEAQHYFSKQDSKVKKGDFKIIHNYGKTLSGLKAFPVTEYFTPGIDAPSLEYCVYCKEAGKYTVELYMQPSNPVTTKNTLSYGIAANNGTIEIIDAVKPEEKVGDHQEVWGAGVLNNIRRMNSELLLLDGVNHIRIYAVTPGLVLEKLVVYKEGMKPADAFLGPSETYYIGRQ